MSQKFTILFDLDGTLIDTAPDLIRAHNHVMKKFGYPTKTLGELKNAVGKGAKAMMAKANGQWKWFDEKIQNEMTDEFLSFYGKNILHDSKLINGVKEFLIWCKKERISMKTKDIIKEFEMLAEQVGIKVIKDTGSFKGGFCIVNDEEVIVCVCPPAEPVMLVPENV